MAQIDVLVHNYEREDDVFFLKKNVCPYFFSTTTLCIPFYVTTDHINHKSSKRINLSSSLCTHWIPFFIVLFHVFLHFFCISICTSLLITVKLPIGDFIWGTLILLYDHHCKKVFPLFLFFIQQNKLKFIKTLI